MKLSGTSSYKSTLPLLVIIVSAMMVPSTTMVGAQTSCGTTFFSSLVQLMPCRAAVSPFNPSPPSEECCNALRAVGQPCLCVLVNGPPITGVDRTMVVQLPDKCTANFDPCEIMP